MRHYSYLFLILLFALIGVISSNAQATSGENSILYLGAPVNDEDDTRTVYILDVENSTEPQAIGYVNDFGSDVGWSPDGNYVYIVNYDEDDNRILTLYNVEADSTQVLSETLNENECYLPLHWSPDGRYLAYDDMQDGQSLMHIWDAVDHSTYVIGEINEDGFSHELWSPQGRYLIPTINDMDELLVWEIVTQSQIATLDAYRPWELYWTTDDRYLMYVDDRNEDGAIVSFFDTMTGEVKPTSGNRPGEFSPDNRYAIYTDENRETWRHTLYFYDLETDSESIITNEALSTWVLGWSSDSNYIAYLAPPETLDDASEVTLYDIQTGEMIDIFTIKMEIHDFSWSPSQAYLAILYVGDSTLEQAFNLVVYNGETQTLINDFDFTLPNIYYGLPITWSLDGQSLVMNTQEQGAVVYDMRNDMLVDIESLGSNNYPFSYPSRSDDGRYMMMWVRDENNNLRYVYDTIEDEEVYTFEDETWDIFIGWRGKPQIDSLIYCGEG